MSFRGLAGICSRGWELSRRLERGRRIRAEKQAGECPSFAVPISRAKIVARRVLSLRPRFVFGMEVFQYGLATAMCKGVPRILMPWGGDIYLYPEASIVSFAMVRSALRRVDLVCPSSTAAVSYLVSRFGVSPGRVKAISWGVDRAAFRRADPSRRAEICARFGIDPSRRLFLNVRRFVPIWGCHIALEAFRRHAGSDPLAHFALLGGAGTGELVREAREKLRSEGLEGRFTLFDGDTPFSDCADLMSVADAFVSLMTVRDMRSASILQAAASGGVPVLCDQPEYRAMEREGFRAVFVPPGDAEAVAGALRSIAGDEALLNEVRRANDRYIAEHEDQDIQMTRLLEAVESVCRE